MDGVDVVLADIHREGRRIRVKEIHFETIPFEEDLRRSILQLCSGQTTSQQLCIANFRVGEAFGLAVLRATQNAGLKSEDIDLVGRERLFVLTTKPLMVRRFGMM